MANLPINYGDTGKVARDKINDSFDALEATVEGYRPHIEDGVRWIGTTNTGVKAEGDSIVMKVEDGYIWYKSESNSWTKIIAVADLKGPQGNPGADGNGIASITSTKIGKTTTVTIRETGGTVDSFEIQDGADGVGGDGDVKGPDSSTNGHMAVFDGTTGKIIRDGGSIPVGFEPGSGTTGQILRKTNSGYEWDDESAGGVTSVNGQTGDVTISVPTKVSDLTNDAGYTTNTGTITSVKMNGNTVSSSGEADLGTVITSHQSIKTVNSNSLVGTGDVTINAVPSGGTEGQVLTKGSSGYGWENAGSGSGDVVVSTDSGNELSTGVGLWLGTETDFSSISTPDANTLYIQYKSDGGGWQPGANTKAYYKINDNDTNTTIYDLSGNGVDQTWSGTGSYTTDATYGRVAVFDGTVYTEASSKVNFGSECTFIALFLRDNTTNQHSIVVECASASAYPIGIACDTPSKYEGFYAGSGFQTPFKVVSTSSATANQWVMVATTRASDGTAKLYINGVLDSTESGMNTPSYSSGNNLRIGNWRDSYYQLEGKFKLFIGENRCRTDQEIADLATEYGFTVS